MQKSNLIFRTIVFLANQVLWTVFVGSIAIIITLYITVKVNSKPTHQATATPDSLKLRLLLSAFQMAEEGYPMRMQNPSEKDQEVPARRFPLPLGVDVDDPYKEFVYTSDSYEEVSDDSPMFSVDCEMCLTTAGKNELTRIREAIQCSRIFKLVVNSNRQTFLVF